nr:MAG TPA: hypothetical protein [Caudoviricetes sp.]
MSRRVPVCLFNPLYEKSTSDHSCEQAEVGISLWGKLNLSRLSQCDFVQLPQRRKHECL